MSNDPTVITQPSTTDLISAAVAPIATQVATQVATGLHQTTVTALADVQGQINAVASDVAANRVAIEQALAKAGSSVLTNLETDTKSQQIVLGVLVGGVVLASLVVLVGYLTGNAQAGKIIAGVPAAGAALVLWLSQAGGIALPKKPVAKP